MSDITTGRLGLRVRTQPSWRLALDGALGRVRAAWDGLRARVPAAQTRRVTEALDNRLRNDIGLGRRAPVPLAMPREADAWMR